MPFSIPYEFEGFERFRFVGVEPVFEFGKADVSFVISAYQRHPHLVNEPRVEERGINLRASDNENEVFALAFHEGERVFRGHDRKRSGAVCFRTGYHDVLSSGKGAEFIGKRFERLATHDHGLSHGDFPEIRQVFRKVPGEFSLATDNPSFFRHCGNENGFHVFSDSVP